MYINIKEYLRSIEKVCTQDSEDDPKASTDIKPTRTEAQVPSKLYHLHKNIRAMFPYIVIAN